MKFSWASKRKGTSSQLKNTSPVPECASKFVRGMVKISRNYDVFSRFLEYIDQSTFVCLGLTCREAYKQIYQRYRTGNPSLEASHVTVMVEPDGLVVNMLRRRVLYRLLEDWCGPGYRYCYGRQKFVKIQLHGRRCHWHAWARAFLGKRECLPCGCAYAKGGAKWKVISRWHQYFQRPGQLVYYGGEFWSDAATGTVWYVLPNGRIHKTLPAALSSNPLGLPASVASNVVSLRNRLS